MAGEYARSGNSTAGLGEAVIAKLEGAEACALFNAGSAAAMAVLSTLRPGDHLILEADGKSNVGCCRLAQTQKVEHVQQQRVAKGLNEN